MSVRIVCMRRIAKGILILALFVTNAVYAADYRVLVIPDNLSSKPCLDAFIYEDSSEFFANQVINRLNLSGTVESPTVSEVRDKLQRNQRLYLATRESLLRFKNGYNINYLNVQKLATMFNTNKVLLITSSADAQNYFIRRTFWDFLNIPGATVIDPAIKLSIYAVLIDTDRMVNLWEDTFYKTISSCENRMVANSLSPQTEQLEKIRDYSRMLGPQIAHYVQASVVPSATLTRANEITYGPKDFDNVFTKKFRWYKHGAKEITKETKYKYDDHVTNQRNKGVEPLEDKFRRWKQEWKARRAAAKAERMQRKQQEMLRRQMEEEQNKYIQDVNNKQPAKEDVKDIKENTKDVIEIKDIQKPASPVKPAVKKHKKQEPKVLNVTKDEYLEPPESDVLLEPKIKYYQPRQRNMPEAKNTTINDI